MDISNNQLAGVQGDEIVILRPLGRMSRGEAIRFAAWLVALADGEDLEPDFATVLAAVRGIP
jgi:hypothetical protein